MTEFAAKRLPANPLLQVTAGDPDLAENINGPSLIRVPDWVESPLGRYYLYFSHHQGTHIRLAYSDDPAGPFTVHAGGVLPLAESGFPVTPPDPTELPADRQHTVEEGKPVPFYAHIASPDAVIVPERQQIRLYYHGQEADGHQYTRVAISADGLTFYPRPALLGWPYFRVFQYQDFWYAMSMPGIFYRSANGLTGFQQGPMLFDRNMRHAALLLEDDTLHVFFSRAGDEPEAILHSWIDLRGDWSKWQASSPRLLLQPEEVWEGADQPLRPSARGGVMSPVRQLRDPAVYAEGERILLYYSIAGEQGIGVAELTRS